MIFIHGCRSKQIFGDAKDFCPIFPKLARKNSKKVTSKKKNNILGAILLIFSGSLWRFSEICPDFKLFFPDFKGFWPDFHQIKTFGCALAPPAPHLLHQCIHLCEDTDHANAIFRTGPRTTHVARGVTRLDGARGKNEVWCSHVQSWGLSEANVLY